MTNFLLIGWLTLIAVSYCGGVAALKKTKLL
jgi:hypothetical protein